MVIAYFRPHCLYGANGQARPIPLCNTLCQIRPLPIHNSSGMGGLLYGIAGILILPNCTTPFKGWCFFLHYGLWWGHAGY